MSQSKKGAGTGLNNLIPASHQNIRKKRPPVILLPLLADIQLDHEGCDVDDEWRGGSYKRETNFFRALELNTNDHLHKS